LCCQTSQGFFQAAIAKSINAIIANPKHPGLNIRKAIAKSSRGDHCVLSKLKGSNFNSDSLMRDAYVTDVPHPLLLCLPSYAVTRLGLYAPDFWDWRSGMFLFNSV
jgi:hypothetical protein